MKQINDPIKTQELVAIAKTGFGNMIKAVVDIEQELLAIDAELHADLEAWLLEKGSKQENLWGINLYPETDVQGFIEFDSMINVRPSRNNFGRGVEDPSIQNKIIAIVSKKVIR